MGLVIHASLMGRSILKTTQCARVRTTLTSCTLCSTQEATAGTFATDISFASNYSLQLKGCIKKKGKYSTENASQHLTVEERDKTFCLGHCLAYSYNSQASLLGLCYLVIPYLQVQEASLKASYRAEELGLHYL